VGFFGSVNGRLRELLLVSSITLVLLAILLSTTERMTRTHPAFASPWDHHVYIDMASNGPKAHVPALCWRILMPYIARHLPFGLEAGFFSITLASICVTSVATYYLSKRVMGSPQMGLAGVFLYFSLYWATKFLVFDFWLTDSLAFMFVVLILHSIVSGKEAQFIALLALGVMAKESVLFTVPLFYSLNATRAFDAKLAAKTVSYALPAIIVIMLLRHYIAPEYGYSYVDSLSRVSKDRIGAILSGQESTAGLVWTYTVRSFGLLFLLPFLSVGRNMGPLLRYSPFLLLVYCQLLIAHDSERLIVLCFPAVILMALNGIESAAKKFSIPPRYVLLLSLVPFALNLLGAADPRLY
jgi:hypothetical protein